MDLRSVSPTFDRTIASLNEAASEFLSTGFLTLDGPELIDSETWSQRWREHNKKYPVGQVFIRKVIRKAAAEAKRPIIIAQSWHYNKDKETTIKLKRTKKTAPLIANFLLLEEGTSTRWDRTGPAVTRRQDGSNWYVTFTGPKGHKALAAWKKSLLADPECRKVLKLDPPTSNPEK